MDKKTGSESKPSAIGPDQSTGSSAGGNAVKPNRRDRVEAAKSQILNGTYAPDLREVARSLLSYVVSKMKR